MNEAYVGMGSFKNRLWQKVEVWDAVRARSAAVRARYTGKRKLPARIFSALQEKFSTPNALEYLRNRIAEFLGESNRDATRELAERRATLARTEQRIAALIRFDARQFPF